VPPQAEHIDQEQRALEPSSSGTASQLFAPNVGTVVDSQVDEAEHRLVVYKINDNAQHWNIAMDVFLCIDLLLCRFIQ